MKNAFLYYGVKIPFKKYLYTFPYFYKESETNRDFYYQNWSNKYFQELRLLANECPNKIGTYNKNIKYQSCFIGTPYKHDWITNLSNIIYYNIWHDKLLSSEERRDIYLSSKFALGFQSDENCYGMVNL